MKKALFSIFLLFFHVTVYPIYFKDLGIKDGLSQLSVMGIYQDTLGRMWFGTKEGLNMYDGENITIFNPSEQLEGGCQNGIYNALEGNEVHPIVGDKQGNIFFKVDFSLMKYDIKEQCFRVLKKGSVQALSSYQNDIWVAVNDSIYRWDDENGKLEFLMKTGLPHNIITIQWDRDKNLWIGTERGLYVAEQGHDLSCIIPDFEIYRIFESSRQGIWVGTRMRGLYKIDKDKKITAFRYRPSDQYTVASDQIREFVEDNQGNIWIGTFSGLNKYNPETGKFMVYAKDNLPGSLTHSSVFSLYKDTQGTIWVGTYYGGVNYFNPEDDIFTYYAESPSRNDCLNFPYVGHMVEDKDHNIWICTEGGGLNMLDRNTRHFRYFTAEDQGNALKHNNLKCICYEPERNKLYIGTHTGGMSSYDINRNQFRNYLDAFHATKISQSIIQDMTIYKNDLIFLDRSSLLKMDLDSERILPLFEGNENIYAAHSFLIDSKGYIWLAEMSRILRINLNDRSDFEVFNCGENGLGRFTAVKIFETKNGHIYIGTQGSGLCLFNEESRTFTRYTAENNQLLSNYCYNITESNQGYLVISGDKGVSFFDPEIGLVKQVGLSSGLPITGINQGCGLLACRNGEIFVGGTDGLVSFYEKELYRAKKDYEFYFSDLFIHNEKVYPGDDHHVLSQALPFVTEIVLNYKQNNLIFNFAFSDYVRKENNVVYEYMLEGFDEDWISTDKTSLYYTNLNPGKYILKIREKDIYSYATPKEIHLNVVIRSPFYTTPWAFLVYFILGASIIYAIDRFRKSKIRLATSLEMERKDKERIEELNQAKLLFFTNISHEFRTPLTLIISQIDLLMQNRSLSPSVYNKILKVSRNAHQMRNLISELLTFRKLEQKHIQLKVSEKDLIAFLKEIYLSFYEYALSFHIDYRFEPQDEKILCWFDPEQMQKVFYNLLSNAFKYTRKNGFVEVVVSRNEDGITIKIIDNGVGIENKELEKIFDRFYQVENGASSVPGGSGTGIGLALTKSIVDLHHGNVSVESRQGYGSIFIVHLLNGNDHFKNDQTVTIVEQPEQAMIEPGTLPDFPIIEEITEVPDALSLDEEDKRCTILLVEDVEELLQILSSLFSPLYDVILARNGEEGLQKTIEMKPDIVLSDVMMPIMSGTEMCHRIKNTVEISHIPVVLLTALTSAEHSIEGLQTGADDYIGKPFNAKVLIARCNNLVRNRLLLQKRFNNQSDFDVRLLANSLLDKELLEKTEKIIEQHLNDTDFTVNQLASELALSRSSLFAKFKALTGMTPNDFILNYKLKRGAVLLKNNPQLQVTEISDLLGFSSARYFSRCFKAQFNISPMEYRKN